MTDVKNRVPMTPPVKFRIASHSQMFAAIAIMQLREEGKSRLDDPVEKYLPWFKAKPTGDDDLKRLYSDRQAAFAPNVRWKYSNLAFAVAGLVDWASISCDSRIARGWGTAVAIRGIPRIRCFR